MDNIFLSDIVGATFYVILAVVGCKLLIPALHAEKFSEGRMVASVLGIVLTIVAFANIGVLAHEIQRRDIESRNPEALRQTTADRLERIELLLDEAIRRREQ